MPTLPTGPRSLLAALLLVLLCASAAAQRTIAVPADQQSVQAGLDAAANGDTVLVSPGTYFEHLDFHGKAITLRSTTGAANTILDGSYTGLVVSMGTSVGDSATLDGFTIQHGFPAGSNGDTSRGGGVVLVGNATVQNNTVQNNKSCGIQIGPGTTQILSNHVLYNGYSGVSGAVGCNYGGAGIFFANFSPATSVISGNIFDGTDQAIDVTTENALETVTISRNIARGGLVAGDAALFVQNQLGTIIVSDNLVYNNQGFGIAFEQYGPTFNQPLPATSIINNTFYENGLGVTTLGTGMEMLGSGVSTRVENNIVVHRSPSNSPVISCSTIGAPIFFGYNDFYSPNDPNPNLNCTLAPTNRSDDPNFASTSANNFHLLASSPEIDAGDNGAPNLPSLDLDGNPRVQSATPSGAAIVDLGAYEFTGQVAAATTTALACAPNPAYPDQSIAFAIAVAQSTPSPSSPSGTVTLTDGASSLATLSLTAGAASYSTSLPIGTHSIAATYQPSPGYLGSAAACTETIVGYPTVTSLTNSPASASFGQTVTLSIAVAGTRPGSIPGGTVTIHDGPSVLGTALLDPTGHATLTSGTISSGLHTLVATYPGNSLFASSSSSPVGQSIALDSTNTTISVSSPASQAFQPFTVSAHVLSQTPAALSACSTACAITFTLSASSGATTSTSIPLSSTADASTQYSLPAGAYQIAASFNGDSNFAPSVSPTLPLAVVPATTLLSLSATPATAFQQQTVTLVANLTAPVSTQLPTGSLVLYDGNTLLATVPLTIPSASIAIASFSTSSLTPGVHTLSSVFPGNSNFIAATSPSVNVTILARDFTAAFQPPTLTLQTEHHGDASLTLTSLGGFADTIDLSCTNLPEAASCNFDRTTLPLGSGQSLTLPVHIDTDVVLGYASLEQPSSKMIQAATGICLASLFFPSWIVRRRRRFSTTMRLLAIVLIAQAFTGCSGKYPDHTPPGVYQITLVAHSRGANLTHTAVLTLTITP